jgi:tripartite-type tricarboxylate transporter receptor subunit TctC
MHTVNLLAAAAVSMVLAAPALAAQGAGNFPERPIRLVIGSASGSGPDIVARLLSERLYKSWGQRVVVDTRPGKAGAISADLVSRAEPDGYTWMILTSQLFIAEKVYKDLTFGLEKDFASVALVGTVPFVLVVNPKLPAKTVPELIQLSKKSKLRYGSAGPGGGEHLCMHYFLTASGAQAEHVAYRGIAQSLLETTAGEIHMTFAVLPAMLPLAKAGRVRPIGVSSQKRAPLFPDIPSISESVPSFWTFGWYSVVAPIKTPPAILEKVSQEVVKAIKEPQFGERLKILGIEITAGTRAELDAFRKSESKRMGDIVESANLQIQ